MTMGKPGGPRKDGKKLSWSYRNKKRQGKIVKTENNEGDNVQIQNKKARIIVRNLSFKVTEEDVKKLYEPFGEVEQIDLLKRPDGKLKGCGFVQFKRIEDASKAIFKTNKQLFLGRPISCSWAISKAKFIEKLQAESENIAREPQEVTLADDSVTENLEGSSNIKIFNSDEQKPKKVRKKLTPEERKEQKLKKRIRRARIIVRNLPFKIDEKILRENFSKYGSIEDVQFHTNSSGKRTGCAFIQFDHVQSAAKAVHYANCSSILDREVIVDFALPKKTFTANTEIKKEPQEVKDEPLDELEENDVKEIEIDDDEVEKNVKPLSDDESNSDSSDEDDNEEEEDEDENDNSEEDESKPIKEEEIPEKRPRVISNDVTEGKTVFLKNVPFSVDNNELEACMTQFGPVVYARVCIDPLTEHSRGTAFVKFQNFDDAEKCLSAGTELRIHDQILDSYRAVKRDEVPSGKSLKSQRTKDTRNLYLVREGVISANTPAAIGVSKWDMTQRLKMEQWKSQMLKNLNMFVSRVRLVVHNLPENLDDLTLRKIFKNHAGPKAVIQEARVMRDLKNPDANGVGKSKGFGFVAFTTHEDALKALRSINNNPNIFSASKRPIVAFSIENRIMVNAKKRRVQKSRDHNPLWKGKKTETSTENNSGEPQAKKMKKSLTEAPEFAGLKSKPGAPCKLRSKFSIKKQAEAHTQRLKQEKKQKKEEKKIQDIKLRRKELQKEIRPKPGKKKVNQDEINFNKLVENYKNKISGSFVSNGSSSSGLTKSKWYDT